MLFFKKQYISALGMAALLCACADYDKAEQPPYTLEETIYVDRLENNNYQLTLNTSGNWEVFQGAAINAIDWNNSQQLSGANASITVTNNNPAQRMFFAAVQQQDTLFLSEREIDMSESVNFRDMGGIATKDGKHTKWGKLFRSGELAELNDEDLAYMKQLKIATILDLRSDAEIEEKPDMYPDGTEWLHIPIGDIGKQSKVDEMMKTIKEADPETFNADDVMLKASEQFVNNTENFKKLFQEVLNEGEDSALLFHCTAGKDRTGFSSAFILKALGVDDETIYNEYILSNYFRYAYNEDMVEKAAKYYGLDQRILRQLMQVKKSWLAAGFEEINKKYGSFENYLEVLGVDAAAQAQLKATYLE